jgi:hypothetical protein
MASRKPLVNINGEFQELPSSDTLDAAVSEVDIVTRTNEEGSTMPILSPVYVNDANGVMLARANADGTRKVLGMAKAAINAGATGSIQVNGIITGSAAEWDVICAESIPSGLTANTDYFLSSATAGLITSTAPTGAGNWVVKVIRAISATEAMILDHPGIKLS